jgi:hypothetical protein
MICKQLKYTAARVTTAVFTTTISLISDTNNDLDYKYSQK